MARFTSLLLSAALCSALATAAPTKDKDKEDSTPGPLSAQIEKVKNLKFKHELKALEKAAIILEGVNDEKSARMASNKIQALFRTLPPLLDGTAAELELLAQAQNIVSRQMWARINEPYFESAKLQELWTLMTDQFSRPSAAPR